MISKIRQFLNKLFPNFPQVLISGALGLFISLSFYLGLLQRHFFSWTYLGYALMIAAAGFFLSGWLNQYLFRRFFSDTPAATRKFALIFSLILTILLFFSTKIQPLYYILPDTNLEIRFTIPQLPANEEGVRLLWVNTGQDNVHYSAIKVDGKWERVFGNSIFAPGQKVVLHWRGKAGPKTEIAFRRTDYSQPVEVIWNGLSRSYDLKNGDQTNVFIRSTLHVPLIFRLPFALSFIIAAGYALLAALIALVNWDPGVRKPAHSKNVDWLLYMLPMLLIWGLTLAAFWPGIMSSDSMTQWTMGATGRYNDWQSGFHAILLAVLMRVWNSPALVAILQILLFAWVAAWGLKVLQEHGVPRIALWGISLLFASFPINGIFAITLWKDIPYAIAFLWLTILIIKIVLAGGNTGRDWLFLGVSVFLVAILRHNGAPVAAVSLLVLLLVYQRTWKPFLGAILVAALLYLGATGPLYSSVKLDRGGSGQSNLILLHHIAAHVAAETPLKPEEKSYLQSLLPLDEWNYLCYYVGSVSYDDAFDRQSFLDNSSRNRQLALNLFLRAPLVDLRHTLCAGDRAWKFDTELNYMKSTHGFSQWAAGKIVAIVDNDFGLKTVSQLPRFADGYITYLRNFGVFANFPVLWLRPAFWLYLAVFSAAVAVMRRRDLHFLLALLPLVCQAGILLLISFAPAYRYHYGTVIAGIFILGMIFVPKDLSEK